jgi:hypothetical protein
MLGSICIFLCFNHWTKCCSFLSVELAAGLKNDSCMEVTATLGWCTFDVLVSVDVSGRNIVGIEDNH